MPKQIENNNKAILIGITLIALVAAITFFRACAGPKKSDVLSDPSAPIQDKEPANGISAEELQKEINERNNLTIIDIRSANSFKAEHIRDSKNLSFEEIKNSFDSLDKRASYVFIGEAGNGQAENLVNQIFVAQGFENAKYLVGGFSEWQENLYPAIGDGDPTSVTDQSKVSYINCDELKKMLETEANLYVVDVRSAHNFSEGHIKDATNIFLDDLESKRKEIPLGKKIVVYDKDGLWAMKAAARLFDMGVFNVKALSEGLDTWKIKGFEVVK